MQGQGNEDVKPYVVHKLYVCDIIILILQFTAVQCVHLFPLASGGMF